MDQALVGVVSLPRTRDSTECPHRDRERERQ